MKKKKIKFEEYDKGKFTGKWNIYNSDSLKVKEAYFVTYYSNQQGIKEYVFSDEGKRIKEIWRQDLSTTVTNFYENGEIKEIIGYYNGVVDYKAYSERRKLVSKDKHGHYTNKDFLKPPNVNEAQISWFDATQYVFDDSIHIHPTYGVVHSYKKYYHDYKIMEEREYRHGMKWGDWKYYEKGAYQPYKKETYDPTTGTKTVRSGHFYSPGKRKTLQHWKFGKEYGIWQEWNDKMQLIYEEDKSPMKPKTNLKGTVIIQKKWELQPKISHLDSILIKREVELPKTILLGKDTLLIKDINLGFDSIDGKLVTTLRVKVKFRNEIRVIKLNKCEFNNDKKHNCNHESEYIEYDNIDYMPDNPHLFGRGYKMIYLCNLNLNLETLDWDSFELVLLNYQSDDGS